MVGRRPGSVVLDKVACTRVVRDGMLMTFQRWFYFRLFSWGGVVVCFLKWYPVKMYLAVDLGTPSDEIFHYYSACKIRVFL